MSEISTGAGAALMRRRRRIPIIWIIPVLAIAIGAWLAWDTVSSQGPTITIQFQSAEGLTPGQSQLKYKELTLGTVKSLTLTPDRSRVVVTIATVREAADLLSDRTVFWVVKPRLFAGTLSGLNTLISGSYVAMLPGKAGGRTQLDFMGLEDPPVLISDVPGRTFLLKADRVGSLNLGSPVFFRDLNVGEILGWDLGDMAENATVHVFVREPFDKYVRTTSRFWNASGLNVKLDGGGIDVQVESLKALILGGIAFDTPNAQSSPVAASDHVFPLYPSRDASDSAVYTRNVPLVSYFPGSIRGLSIGADVLLHGLKIGRVTQVALSYDRATDSIVAPVHFEVQPERFLGVGKEVFKDVATGVNELVRRGLRASLSSASLITGQMLVSLEFDPQAPEATVTMEGKSFVLPAVEGGNFSGLQAAATELLGKVNSMPFAQIGHSLQAILQGVEGVAGGPQLKQSLAALTATLTSAQETFRKVNAGIGPLTQRLPDIAANLDGTMKSANQLVQSLDAGYGDNTKFNRDLGRLMVELNDAVRSVRALADLLSRHPEVLVRGRTNTGLE